MRAAGGALSAHGSGHIRTTTLTWAGPWTDFLVRAGGSPHATGLRPRCRHAEACAMACRCRRHGADCRFGDVGYRRAIRSVVRCDGRHVIPSSPARAPDSRPRRACAVPARAPSSATILCFNARSPRCRQHRGPRARDREIAPPRPLAAFVIDSSRNTGSDVAPPLLSSHAGKRDHVPPSRSATTVRRAATLTTTHSGRTHASG